jgi:hypothetical protein
LIAATTLTAGTTASHSFGITSACHSYWTIGQEIETTTRRAIFAFFARTVILKTGTPEQAQTKEESSACLVVDTIARIATDHKMASRKVRTSQWEQPFFQAPL